MKYGVNITSFIPDTSPCEQVTFYQKQVAKMQRSVIRETPKNTIIETPLHESEHIYHRVFTFIMWPKIASQTHIARVELCADIPKVGLNVTKSSKYRIASIWSLHPSHQQAMRSNYPTLVLLILGVLVVMMLPPLPEFSNIANYLPLHTLLEILAIVIAMLVFAVGWNTFNRRLPDNILLLSSVFLGVGLLDCSHMLSYSGMPDFLTANTPEKAINFWLAARSLAMIALFIVSFTPWRFRASSIHRYGGLLLVLGVVMGIHWLFLFHHELLPRTFIPGKGLTPFKIYYEYAIVGLSVVSACVLLLRMSAPLSFNAPMLFSSVCTMALSEFLFTLYAEVTDIYILLGHIYKSVSYLFLYRAIFVETIEHPYNQLRSTERQLQFLTNNVPVFIAQCDAEKRYRFVNRPYAELFGLTQQDLIGKHVRQILGEQNYAITKPYMDLALSGKAVSYDHLLQSGPNDERAILVKYEPEHDINGHIVGFIAAISDITERKQAEQATTRTRDLLQSIIEHAPVRIFWKDPQLRYLGANTLFAKDAGYASVEQLVNKTDVDMAWKEQAELYRIDDLAVIDSNTSKLDFEELQTTPDGRTTWLRTSKVPLHDANDQIIGVLGIYQDITERKKAESELRKLSQVVEQNPNPILITDVDANIEYVNQAFIDLTGYSRDEVIGQNPRILNSNKTPASVYKEMWSHLNRGKLWRGELINKRKDGREYIDLTLIAPVRQPDGQITHYFSIKENITRRKQAEERIEKLAHFDQLTGLPNRELLLIRFKFAFGMAKRNSRPLAVFFLDLDRFKNVNDTLGHSIGDQLLIAVAGRIKGAIREEDTVSRLGGDEFILILPNTHENGAAHVAGKLIKAISEPYHINQHELIITPSIGISIYPNDGDDFETLSKNADAAMYRVKQAGRNNFCFYAPEMQEHSARALRLESALRHALSRNELQLYYQPQVSIKDGLIVGAEALLRWRHPELGMVPPNEFIPIAEDSGQITQIGAWVLRTAARQLKQWKTSGMPGISVAVNLSAVQFLQANLSELVTQILDETNLPYDSLELELTEAVAMGDPETAIEVMDKLHALGIRMSIDDFGTGYSSLSYLKKFKVAKLKIDQSFVRDITEDPEDKAIVGAIINMATSLGIKTIAEGVETSSQLAFLRLQGCDEVQGYYFSKPLPADQFEAFVHASMNNSLGHTAPAGELKRPARQTL